MIYSKMQSMPNQTKYGAFWGSMLVLVFFFVLFVAVFSITPNGNVNVEVLFSFAVNGAIGLFALLQAIRKRSFSLAIMHWVFYLLFFVFAPVIQYILGSFPWSFNHSNDSIVQGNLLLTVWALIIWILQSSKSRRVFGVNQKPNWLPANLSVPLTALNVLVFISGLITVYMIATVGLSDLFARSTNELVFDSSSIRQIVEKTSRATVAFVLIASIIRYKSKSDCMIQLILALIFCLITCFPAGMPRYSAAAIWGSILLVSFSVFKKKKTLFPALFILAFLVVFPAINVYKGADFATGDFLAAAVNVAQHFFDTFLGVSYDAYSVYLRTILYASEYQTWGYQLLGALLFFVPRSFWPSKPLGSGATVVAAQGQTVTNVSCPLPAEAIINFGFLGLIVGAFCVGWLIKRIDDYYWHSDERSLFVTISYPQLLFFFFYMMRGDLLSSLAFTTAFMITNLILATICRSAAVYSSNKQYKKSKATTVRAK